MALHEGRNVQVAVLPVLSNVAKEPETPLAHADTDRKTLRQLEALGDVVLDMGSFYSIHQEDVLEVLLKRLQRRPHELRHQLRPTGETCGDVVPVRYVAEGSPGELVEMSIDVVADVFRHGPS